MTTKDRIFIIGNKKPEIATLAWNEITPGLWSGKISKDLKSIGISDDSKNN
jgi:hypothetical protein